MPDSVTDVTDVTDQPAAAGEPVTAGLDGPADGSWELLEIVAAVIIVAQALRLVGSVISGIVYGVSTHTGAGFPSQLLLGTTLQTIAGFADGPGLVLLLVSLGLVWWRTAHWSERLDRSIASGGADGGEPGEAIQLRRLDRLAIGVGWLLVLVAVGAIVFLIGVFLINTVNGEPTSTRVSAFAQGTFPLAYAVIAGAGAFAARHLSAQCRGALSRI
jgi:hypothetical protein